MFTQAMSVILLTTSLAPGQQPASAPAQAVRFDGYRGIWWGQEPTKDEYSYKYSGGLGTYTAHHRPMAVYSEKANKTFFVYGGSEGTGTDKQELVAMAAYFDHATKTFPRPALVYDKETSDPHDNPAMTIDPQGRLWVFVSGRGRTRPGHIFRSCRPYDIGAWERIQTSEFAYPQPWCLGEQSFVFLFTKYLGGRQLFWRTSDDGVHWSEDHPFAQFEGHYEVSAAHGRRLATAWNYHPGGKVDFRTNLYYAETLDAGRTWRNIRGETLSLPLTAKHNAALVFDEQARKRLVYLDDLAFDSDGRPIVLYVESTGWQPGPANGKRTVMLAHWTGEAWERLPITQTDHNYDTGSVWVEGDTWRYVGPTDPGPQAWHTGGEIVQWESRDAGKNWTRVRSLTKDSPRNQTYVRRPLNAHPDFCLFWADGDSSKRSDSRLYFTNRACDPIYRMPWKMAGDTAPPETVP